MTVINFEQIRFNKFAELIITRKFMSVDLFMSCLKAEIFSDRFETFKMFDIVGARASYQQINSGELALESGGN